MSILPVSGVDESGHDCKGCDYMPELQTETTAGFAHSTVTTFHLTGRVSMRDGK